MKVKDLIEKFKTVDPETEVYVNEDIGLMDFEIKFQDVAGKAIDQGLKPCYFIVALPGQFR